jgi:cell division protein FtsZ
MMGTGEASGERRAAEAAEAAIANPLLDETSMRGARGLLISITGGKDLTLFEVDEAATRIREEVDPEANIILGATFEESLEGVIRVSVVATGIEGEAQAASSPTESRMAELSQRLKATAQSQPAAQPKPIAAPARTPQADPAPVAATPARTIPVERQPQPARPAAAHLSGGGPALAAAAAGAAERGITIAPFDPHAADYGSGEIVDNPAVVDEPQPPAASEPFMPPPAERPPTRIPRVEDFPPVAQRQMDARRGAGSRQHEEDRGPLSLLRRLAAVGLGRREDDPIGAGPPVRANKPQPPLQRQPGPAAAPPRPQQTAPQPRAQQEALYRPRQGNLDPHGRPLPRETRPLEDELEIPAFLRRQAT